MTCEAVSKDLQVPVNLRPVVGSNVPDSLPQGGFTSWDDLFYFSGNLWRRISYFSPGPEVVNTRQSLGLSSLRS